MKHLLTILISSLCATSAWCASVPNYLFDINSLISTGKWVKIKTGKTGIYQITYDELREMGFTNPEAVCIYGSGARPMPTNFASTNGKTKYQNFQLPQVSVKHAYNKIFFYACGPESIGHTSDEEGYYFTRGERNLYSDSGYYLLSETGTPQIVETLTNTYSEKPEEMTTLWRYLYNEDDKIQGLHQSGQLFWDKLFDKSHTSYRWNFTLTDADTSTPVVLDAGIYTSNDDPTNTVTVQLLNNSNTITVPFVDKNASNFKNTFPTPSRLKLPPSCPGLTMKVATGNTFSTAAIDYWLLSYRSNIPSSLTDTYDMLTEPAESDRAISWKSTQRYYRMWDVTDPLAPIEMQNVTSGSTNYTVVPASADAKRVALFDISRAQNSISSWEDVPNSSIREYFRQDPEMIIITTNSLREHAQRLADIHAETDGLRCVVVTVDEIYNEFNAGTPDIMAYRNYIRHIWERTGKKLKNVLLFGPLSADLRGISLGQPHDASENIIAFQANNTSITSDTPNINDFLGMMVDNIYTRFEYMDVDLGVGVIPCRGNGDAEIVLEKIERYLKTNDFDEYANYMTGICGSGDQNLHSSQMLKVVNVYNDYLENSARIEPILFDAYTPGMAQKAIMNSFDKGTLIAVYMGHSSMMLLNGPSPFTKASIVGFKNKRLPFMLFGSCDITDYDHDKRGMGESLFMDSEYGTMGGLVTTRTAWSSQNEAFIKQLLLAFFYDANNAKRTAPVSFGEAFALAKTRVRSSHEHTFQILGDPSLVMPVPLYDAKVEASGIEQINTGTVKKIKGSICDITGNKLSTFNGKFTARLMSPMTTFVSANYLSSADEPHQSFDFEPYELSVNHGEVVNGNFEFEIEIPASGLISQGDATRLLICAYDPATKLTASSATMYTVNVLDPSSDPELFDTRAPEIETFAYDAATESIEIRLRDNRSINFGGNLTDEKTTLHIDNRAITDIKWNIARDEQGDFVATAVVACPELKGEHAARLVAADNQGNSSIGNIIFQAGVSPELTLEADRNVGAVINLSLAGGTDLEKARLMVADANGRTLKTVDFNGNNTQISCQALNLGEGVYRVWIISEKPAKMVSNTLTLAIMSVK